MALLCSLLICVNVWKCDSCEYGAAPFEHTAKVRIRCLQWIPRCCVNIGIGCKLHSVNNFKRRTSCGWQYTNVRTCVRHFFPYVHMVDFCKKKLARTKYLFDLTFAKLCAQGNVSSTEYKLVSKLLDENCQHSAKFNEQSCTTMDDSIQ